MDEHIAELEALASIFSAQELRICHSWPLTLELQIKLEGHDCFVQLGIVMPLGYPDSAELLYGSRVFAPGAVASEQHIGELRERLAAAHTAGEGGPVVYDLASEAQTWLQERIDALEKANESTDVPRASATRSSTSSGGAQSQANSAELIDLTMILVRDAAKKTMGRPRLGLLQRQILSAHVASGEYISVEDAMVGLRDRLWRTGNAEERSRKLAALEQAGAGTGDADADIDDAQLSLEADSDDPVDLLLVENVEALVPEPPPPLRAGELSDGTEVECAVCLDDVDVFQVLCTGPCGHVACLPCWREYVASAVRSGSVYLNCFGHECRAPLPEPVVLALLSANQIDKWTSFGLDSMLDLGPWKWCFSSSCSHAYHCEAADEADDSEPVEARGSDSKPMKPLDHLQAVLCGGCGRVTCPECHREAHAPANCEQISTYLRWAEGDRAALVGGQSSPVFDDDLMEDRLVVTKKCPKCATPWEHMSGCNHMRCMKCGLHFCFVCLKPWEGHTNFYECNGRKVEGKETVVRSETDAMRQAYFAYLNELASREQLAERALFHRQAHGFLMHLASKKKRMRRLAEAINSTRFSSFVPLADVAFARHCTRFIAAVHHMVGNAYCWLFTASDDEVSLSRIHLHYVEFLVAPLNRMYKTVVTPVPIIQIQQMMKSISSRFAAFGAAIRMSGLQPSRDKPLSPEDALLPTSGGNAVSHARSRKEGVEKPTPARDSQPSAARYERSEGPDGRVFLTHRVPETDRETLRRQAKRQARRRKLHQDGARRAAAAVAADIADGRGDT